MIGIILVMESIFFKCRISSIIMTNKNKIAIAPTQTIINIKGIKLNPNNNNKAALLRKTNTNQKTECIGFKDEITIIDPNKVIKDK